MSKTPKYRIKVHNRADGSQVYYPPLAEELLEQEAKNVLQRTLQKLAKVFS